MIKKINPVNLYPKTLTELNVEDQFLGHPDLPTYEVVFLESYKKNWSTPI